MRGITWSRCNSAYVYVCSQLHCTLQERADMEKHWRRVLVLNLKNYFSHVKQKEFWLNFLKWMALNGTLQHASLHARVASLCSSRLMPQKQLLSNLEVFSTRPTFSGPWNIFISLFAFWTTYENSWSDCTWNVEFQKKIIIWQICLFSQFYNRRIKQICLKLLCMRVQCRLVIRKIQSCLKNFFFLCFVDWVLLPFQNLK